MGYSISTIEGIGKVFAEKLIAAGVKKTSDLLSMAASAKGRKELAKTSGLDEKQILKWVNMADLMRVKGVAEEYSELLEAAGVDTVKELKTRKADKLTEKMAEVNETRKLVRRNPTLSEVQRWIDHAKTLDAVVTH